MSLETQLRDALAARADELDGPAFDPYERVTGAVVTSRRRRRGAAIGAVAAVAAVAVLVPGLSQGDHRSTLPAKRTQVIVPGPNDPRWHSYTTWPTRGSLSTDKAFLDAVGARFGATNILFAADLDRTRVVVAWTPYTDSTSAGLTMYSGRLGATVDELRRVSEAEVEDGGLVTVRENSDDDSRLVVLTTPGPAELSVSRTVQIALDGTVTREAFAPVRTTDGVYSAVLKGSPPSLTRVKDGSGTGSPVLLTGTPTRAPEGKGTICFNCAPDDFRVKAELAMGETVATNLGIDASDVTTTTRYFGPADATVAGRAGITDGTGDKQTHRLLVVDATLPGGQVLRSALLVSSTPAGTGSASELATSVPIAAATAERRPFTIQGPDQKTGRMSYQVFAPDASTVRLVSAAPTIYPPSDLVTVRNGSAVLTTPMPAEGATPYEVVTYDRSGAESGRWPVELPASNSWMEGGQP
ncbi:hypothetical protein [Pedococcus soli]